MSSISYEDNSEVTRNISLLWIILYLQLHLFVAQIFWYENSYLYLRLAFLTFLIVVLGIKRETLQLRDIFFGRWLRGRKDWIIAVLFILLVLAFRIVLSLLFHFVMEPFTPTTCFMIAIVPLSMKRLCFVGFFWVHCWLTCRVNPGQR